MSRKSATSHKNVLPNTYIPFLSSKVQSSLLNRLPRASLIELMNMWARLLNTQPHEAEGKSKQKARSIIRQIIKRARELKDSTSKVTKKKIGDMILFEYWHKGLNLLQLSQIDCQLIVDRPNSYCWISSKVIDTKGKDVAISLDPIKFLSELAKELNLLYMTYIYVCKHPKIPSYLVRVQLFDLDSLRMSRLTSQPHISSHRPFFISLPMNSPYVIHSVGNDMFSEIILQGVERSLSRILRAMVSLQTSRTQKPVRSLHSMHVLNGSSRFRDSLGVWMPYADGTVDILPLAPLEEHLSIIDKVEKEDVLSNDQKLANLRFRGSVDGNLKSKKYFEDSRMIQSHQKRKSSQKRRDNPYQNHSDDEQTELATQYSSIAPIQFCQFQIREPIKEEPEKLYSNITIKLTGSDVFAGMFELSTKRNKKEERYIEVETLPGWLTGEEGSTCGVVKEGKFHKDLNFNLA